MLRVVVDTNVYISAFHFGGAPETLLRLARRKAFLLYVSDAIAEEVEEVLAEKFGYSGAALQVIRRQLSRATRRVGRIRVRVQACADPDDDKVLECALTVRADYIISGDGHLLVMHPFRRIPILRPRAFLDLQPWKS
jgi:putative PIN family toxin of toxin-antitoxin system